MVDSVSLIRSGYEYGTVYPIGAGLFIRKAAVNVVNAIAMSHAVNCPNYIFMVEHPIPTSFHYDMAALFSIENFPKLRACNPNFGQTCVSAV